MFFNGKWAKEEEEYSISTSCVQKVVLTQYIVVEGGVRTKMFEEKMVKMGVFYMKMGFYKKNRTE